MKKKKSLPTDPNFEDHAIGNTHIFFWPYKCIINQFNFIMIDGHIKILICKLMKYSI
jgi:hypothetical protein